MPCPGDSPGAHDLKVNAVAGRDWPAQHPAEVVEAERRHAANVGNPRQVRVGGDDAKVLFLGEIDEHAVDVVAFVVVDALHNHI